MSRGGATRFRKGQSGNPKGRPRKTAPAASAFDVIFDKTLSITQNGVERELTIEEVLQLRTYQAALAGNRPARTRILKMILEREEWLAQHAPQRRPVELVMEHDPRNADEALLLLGIATRDERDGYRKDGNERLLLEPWIVNEVLQRGRGLQVEGNDYALLRNSVRDAQKVAWP